jgi:thiamine-phosphate diphosphorylase
MGGKIVGISTHDAEQAKAAERNGADYIGIGPMFGSATKATGYTARGIEMLEEIRAAVKLPIVAIGGITEQNVSQVWRAGADSAAIISDILNTADIAAKTKTLIARR